MAGRSENRAVTVLHCAKCETACAGITSAVALEHKEDGTHTLIYPRPDHGTVSIWNDVRAVLEHIRKVEFYCGFLPEKPREMTARELEEVVRLQLGDARAVLSELANALADGSAS